MSSTLPIQDMENRNHLNHDFGSQKMGRRDILLDHSALHRWRQLKKSNGMETDTDVANFLIRTYEFVHYSRFQICFVYTVYRMHIMKSSRKIHCSALMQFLGTGACFLFFFLYINYNLLEYILYIYIYTYI